ncbi:MAG: hypothetical protein IPP64_16155 [Bacteroidetes bacterium]|nr:hypothetical protein [Bacteroidota bacterium]
MDSFEESQKNYNLAVNKLNEAINILAESISSKIRIKKDKKERLTILKDLQKVPSIQVLKKVNEIAIENEDYETCDAIKDFCKYKGIVL